MHPFVMIAPNGSRRSKADHPALPVTIPEIVATAAACHTAGADALHLHVRDAEGQHSLDPGLYREALAELSAQLPDLRVQITTEAAGRYGVQAQYDCLRDLRPAWASISVREIARNAALAPAIYAGCAAQGTEVQHILYDLEDVALLKDWQARGIVRPGQDAVLFVLGRYGATRSSAPEELAPFRAASPEATDWMVCAFGPREHACLISAAQQGGAVRVGFENSLTAVDGTPHRDNAASLRDLGRALERQSS